MYHHGLTENWNFQHSFAFTSSEDSGAKTLPHLVILRGEPERAVINFWHLSCKCLWAAVVTYHQETRDPFSKDFFDIIFKSDYAKKLKNHATRAAMSHWLPRNLSQSWGMIGGIPEATDAFKLPPIAEIGHCVV